MSTEVAALARRLAQVEQRIDVERLAAEKQLAELLGAVVRIQVLLLRQRRAAVAEGIDAAKA